MRRIVLLTALGLLVGCGEAKSVADISMRFGGAGLAGPVEDGDWYRPATDDTWQWQISGDVNIEYDVTMYDVDLFEVPTVVIDELHSNDRAVICYFSAGSVEDWRPDAGQFLDEDIGSKLDGWPGERWLDVRSDRVFSVMLKRLELAVEKGCDGVEPDNVNANDESTGFNISREDQLAYNKALANAARTLGLAIGLKNAGDLAEELEPYYDFSLNEQCHQYDECAQLAPFTAAGKPIWNAEYPSEDNVSAAEELARTVCPKADAASTRTLILPLELDDSFRVSCD